MQAQCAGLKWPQALFRYIDESTLPPSKKKLLDNTPDLPPIVSSHDEAQRRLALEDPSDSEDETQPSPVYAAYPAPSDDSESEWPTRSRTPSLDAAVSRAAPPVAYTPAGTTTLVGGVARHFALPDGLDDEPPPLMAPSPPLASDSPPTPYRPSSLLPLPETMHTVESIHVALNNAAAALEATMNEGFTAVIDGEPRHVFASIDAIPLDWPDSLSAPGAAVIERTSTSAVRIASEAEPNAAPPAPKPRPKPKPKKAAPQKAVTAAVPKPKKATPQTVATATEPVVAAPVAMRRSGRGKPE